MLCLFSYLPSIIALYENGCGFLLSKRCGSWRRRLEPLLNTVAGQHRYILLDCALRKVRIRLFHKWWTPVVHLGVWRVKTAREVKKAFRACQWAVAGSLQVGIYKVCRACIHKLSGSEITSSWNSVKSSELIVTKKRRMQIPRSYHIHQIRNQKMNHKHSQY